MTDYLLIGGGLACAHAAMTIRKTDAEGPLTIVAAEPELPYTRPNLSKEYVRGEMERAKVFPRDAGWYAANNVRVLSGRRAAAIDRRARAVALDDGSSLPYGKLLIATGGSARRAKFPGADLRGIYYLRTIADSEAIRDAAAHAKTAVVVGGGFIGCELAASLTQKGVAVSILLSGSVLLDKQIGNPAGKFLTDYFRAKGVSLVTGERASEFIGAEGHVRAVKAESGREFPCDIALVGIGIGRNTALAEAAGLKVDNGILVNEFLQTSDPDIYAAGDVAAFFDPRLGRVMRIEHWDNAVSQGKTAGANMAGAGEVFDHVHYFYSDMFDLSFNAYGDMYEWNEVIERVPADGGAAGRAFFYLQNGRLKASLLVNAMKAGKIQKALAAAAPMLSEADRKRYADAGVPLEELVPQ